MFINKRVKVFLKMVCSIAIIIFLLSRLEVRQINSLASRMHYTDIINIILVYILLSFVEILKFRSACLNKFTVGMSTKLVLLGVFFNNFLPSNVGGDVYKLYKMKKLSVPTDNAIVFLISDRITGLISLLFLGILACIKKPLLFKKVKLSLNTISYNYRFHFLIVGIFSIVILMFIYKKYNSLILGKFEKINNLINEYIKNGAKRTLFFGMIFQTLRAINIMLIGKALGTNLHILDLLFILMLVGVISSIPVSIGGLGIREGSLSALLYLLGVPHDIAITISLTNLVLLIGKSIIGGIFLFLDNDRAFVIDKKYNIQGDNNNEG